MDVDDAEQVEPEEDVKEEEEEQKVKPLLATSRSGRTRKVVKLTYAESPTDDEDQDDNEDDDDDEIDLIGKGLDSVGANDDGDDEAQPRYPRRQRNKSKLNGVIVTDDEGQTNVGRYSTRLRSQVPSTAALNGPSGGRLTRRSTASGTKRSSKKAKGRRTRPNVKGVEQDDAYVDDPNSSVSEEGSLEDDPKTSPDPEPEIVVANDADTERELDDQEQDGRKYALRQRAPVNYAVLPPLEDMKAPSPKARGKARNGRPFGGSRTKPPGWSATGAELSRWMGGGDDSVSTLKVSCPHVPTHG